MTIAKQHEQWKYSANVTVLTLGGMRKIHAAFMALIYSFYAFIVWSLEGICLRRALLLKMFIRENFP